MSDMKPGVRRGLAFAPAIAIAAALLGGCAGSPPSNTGFTDRVPLPPDTMTVVSEQIGRYGGRFVFGATSAPKTLNPMMANENSSTDVTNLLFTSLVSYDNGRQIDGPMLARSWETSADGLTWTFHLRRGARFSDGHPITASDVLFSFEVGADTTLHTVVGGDITVNGRPFDVTAPDSYTVVVRTPKVLALMLAYVGSVKILPRHVLEPVYRAGRFASAYATNTTPDSLVTSAAWRLETYAPGEKLVLTRNPYWFGVDARGRRLPYLDELVFLVVPDQNTATLKFQAGEIDGLDNVKPEDYATYEKGQQAGHYVLYDLGPSVNTNFIWFNLNRVHTPAPGRRIGEPQVDAVKYAWFSDVRFRRAVSMAIDRDAIIRSVLFGQAIKNWTIQTAANREWHDDSITGPDYDPAGAKKLLAEMGFRDTNGDGVLEDRGGHPIRFTLETNADNNLRVQMANFVKDDLARVGIDCVPAPLEFNTLITHLRQELRYDAMFLGLGSAVPPDPGMARNVYRSTGMTHYWCVNQTRPGTAAEGEMDRLIDLNVSTLDPAVRHRTTRELNTIWNEQVFTIWMPTLIARLPVRDRFGNVHPVAIPHRILWNIDQVYVKTPQAGG
ncbi:MAG: ABC transporter substrate-binding protein [Candidatus Eisenbacteria bacterium]